MVCGDMKEYVVRTMERNGITKKVLYVCYKVETENGMVLQLCFDENVPSRVHMLLPANECVVYKCGLRPEKWEYDIVYASKEWLNGPFEKPNEHKNSEGLDSSM